MSKTGLINNRDPIQVICHSSQLEELTQWVGRQKWKERPFRLSRDIDRLFFNASVFVL